LYFFFLDTATTAIYTLSLHYALPILPMPLPEPGEDNLIAKAFSDPQSMTFKAFANPPDLMAPGTVNSRQWRAAEMPAANALKVIDRKSTRLNSSHVAISYAVFCLQKK